ncbi:MAG: asparagine synthase (glutamine-hydrolyzing) [Holophagaceae bacterium]
MCGIAGAFAYHAAAPPVDREALLRVREAMARRGPDGAGLWLSPDGRVGLAHRRLAILDPSDAGAQPMASADGRLAITFNGEIYNFRTLKAGLEARGHAFRSGSDTEVVLALYREKGEALVEDLRGMYAFALWDAERGGLLLARDPFGIKPLYVADDGGTLRFASQVKALLKDGAVDAAPDPAGHAGFFLWGSVPEPFTTFRGIRALPAGCLQWVDARGPRPVRKHFDLNAEFRRAEAEALDLPQAEMQERVRAALLDSVAHHLVSDVPVGLFLSSGYDSTTLTALVAEAGAGDLHTLTLGFREFRGTPDDETVLAARVAGRYGVRHEAPWIGKQDFVEHLEDALEAMDQPSIDGVNTYFVARAAARRGMKVAISGLGGDELFGGYPSFRQVPRLARNLALLRPFPGLGRALRRLAFPFSAGTRYPKALGLLEVGGTLAGAYLLRRALFMPWELPGLVGEAMAREGLETLQPLEGLESVVAGLHVNRARVSALELSSYMKNQLLRDADWAGMAHGLEIRTPLVDVALFRALLPLLAAARPPSKRDLAAAARPGLPPELLTRPKRGFITPVRQWIQDPRATGSRDPGLRGWARRVAGLSAPEAEPKHLPRRRVLALLTDAYGGHGGIAQFNQDLLGALASHPEVAEIVALPRVMPLRPERVPSRVRWAAQGLGGKASYLAAALREVARDPAFDLVVVGHINLLPLSRLLRPWIRAPRAMVIHGVDAWEPTRSPLANRFCHGVETVLAVSRVTASRFQAWARVDPARISILQNAVHLDHYGLGPRPAHLLARYGLEGRKVLLTLGRMASLEHYKGFDEVLEALPSLSKEEPRLVYVMAGDGNDRDRLEAKADALGVRDRVVFTGRIPEEEKADHYRLADAYVMPSRGEGFGRVFLEAMACGIPVVASRVDGSREAVAEGRLGFMVDPGDPADVMAGIRAALAAPREVPAGLEAFAYPAFVRRVHGLVDGILDGSAV